MIEEAKTQHHLADAVDRELATDPLNSYIVQAPAGSGKTEVLTQRYLRLLSTVHNPAEIICLTFTKKAANEMRERILEALKSANLDYKPSSEHKQRTYNYAKAALEKSNHYAWNILEQPHSLKIITIDSLCQSLANAIFIQESHTAFADISTDPSRIYQNAARECLRYAAEDPTYQQDLQNLLRHLDNRQNNLIDLFTDLLSSRDTWLENLYLAKNQARGDFEKAIQLIEKNAIANFIQHLNIELRQKLLNTIQILLNTIGNYDSELAQLSSLEALTANAANELCSILLTSTNNLRKAFDHHVGLKKGVCDEAEYQNLKVQSKDLLTKLAAIPNFLEALIYIKNLPNPQYSEQQWNIIQSLFKLLPLLVAHLNVEFSETNQVDFTGVASEALVALGEELNPTNLALYLDNKIQHILVDEFQDTSLTQFQLLTKMTHGWSLNDGRTLFIVGDPQQSIYRFRGAEVGLFLKAKLFGIGNVKLTPLNLTCNFRSDFKIVNWVNMHFPKIFPSSDNISSGAIQYATSIAVNPNNANSFIEAYEFEDVNQEAIFIRKIIHDELQLNPNASIAILVRSRNQLTNILDKLRADNIPYQGVDIDLLAKQWHIRDVHNLTQALLLPGNRLTWLSLLRSPFCGLSLEDILTIANYAPQKSIYFTLTNLSNIQNLTNDGLLRAKYVFAVLQNAINSRAQNETITWLQTTLKNLYVDAIFTKQQTADLDQYWQLLSEHLQDGEVIDWELLNKQLNSIYAKQSQPAQLQIMTIHKSKGLEFDCVIIPSLGAKSSTQDNSLFRSLKLPDDNGDDIFLLSPIKSSSEEQCKLYTYLKKLDEQKTNYELQRLLYVALTRAKSRLYLTDCASKSINKNSFRSFLKDIEFKSHPNFATNTHDKTIDKLYRLPSHYYAQDFSQQTINLPAMRYTIHNQSQRIIGIVTHELLQWICNNNMLNTANKERILSGNEFNISAHEDSNSKSTNQFETEVEFSKKDNIYLDVPWTMITNRLLSFGIDKDEAGTCLDLIKRYIYQLSNDKIGKWIIYPHTDAKNEYEILVKNGDSYATKIIDRIFVEAETLWIIDFKTGTYNPTSHQEYINQVNEYAQALKHTYPKIKCGLYYLDNNYWYITSEKEQLASFDNLSSSIRYDFLDPV